MSYQGRQHRPRDPQTGKLYQIIGPARKLSPPPKAIRRARPDNLTLVPASFLPFKEQYQELANTLPDGDVLIVLPASDNPTRRALQAVIDDLKFKGHQVTTLLAEQVR